MSENEFYNRVGDAVDQIISNSSEVLRSYINATVDVNSDITEVIMGVAMASIRYSCQISVQTVLNELLSLGILDLEDVPETFHTQPQGPSRSIFRVIDGHKNSD